MATKKANTAQKTKLTITNGEALKYLRGLQALDKVETPLPTLTGYRVLQNVHALDDALKPMGEAEKKLLVRYSGGKPTLELKPDDEGYEDCVKELNELQSVQIEVEIIKIPLKQIENSALPVSALFALDFMLDDGEG